MRAISPRPAAAPQRRGASGSTARTGESPREWAPRSGSACSSPGPVAAALPLLGGAARRAPSSRSTALGDGPEWLYQALDPHSRNYLLWRRGDVAG